MVMVTIEYGWGNRLGNTMLMYAAAYIFAKKHNLYLNVDRLMPHFPLSPDKPELYSTGFNETASPLKSKVLLTSRYYEEPVIPVHDDTFLNMLSANSLKPAHYHFQHYFQLKDFVLPYKQEIKNIFEINYIERPEEQMFVIVRLGDVAKRRQRLPLSYYIEAIENLQQSGCKGGYITSDSPSHPDVQYLAKHYNLNIYTSDIPIETLNFGKDFKNLVLSEGTYCWWVGLLSNASKVYYNNRRNAFTWHGDIFVYPDWIPLNHDNPELPVDPC